MTLMCLKKIHNNRNASRKRRRWSAVGCNTRLYNAVAKRDKVRTKIPNFNFNTMPDYIFSLKSKKADSGTLRTSFNLKRSFKLNPLFAVSILAKCSLDTFNNKESSFWE